MEQQALLLAGMFGAEAEWPDVDTRVEEFQHALAAEPKLVDGDELELRRALGLRGGGGG